MPLDVRGYQANRAAAAEAGALLEKSHQRSDAPDATGRRPSSASLTALRPRGLTQVANEFSGTGASTKAGSRVKEAVASIRKNQWKAKNAGVDCARKSFWSKALGVALAALGVAVVVSLAVSTGGAALAAAAGLAGIVFAVSVADSGCAYMNLKNAQAIRDGKPPPYDLPGGSSSIRNLAHRAYTGMGMSQPMAKLLAGWTDGLLRNGMGVATAVCTMGVTTAAQSFERIAPIVAASVNLVVAMVDLKHNRSTSKVYVDSQKEVSADFDRVRREIQELEQQIAQFAEDGDLTEEEFGTALFEIAQLKADLQTSEDEVNSDVSTMKNVVPELEAGVVTGVTTAAALAIAVVPGLEWMRSGNLVHQGPVGGAAGGMTPNSQRQGGLLDPYARA